jgi:FtsZ-binding cell division protein ZapB
MLPAWAVTITVALLGALGGFIVALMNRGPALETAMNARIETLVTSQDRHIQTLMKEVHNLREQVEALSRALQVRNEHCHACEHWQELIQPELERIGGGCRHILPEAI